MKLFLVFLLLVVIATCARPSAKLLKNKVQTAASTHCSNPTAASQAKLRTYLRTYEALVNKREPAVSFARGVLDGSVSCPGNRKKAVTSDSVTISCPTTSYDVQYGTVSFDCSFTVELDDGIYYYYFYAYDSVNGNYVYNYPSDNYYYDSTASETTLSGTLSFTLPQYAPSGSWTVYGYAYDLNYATDVYDTTYFTVAATLNDQGPPVLKNISFPAVDSASSTSGYVPFVATDDLSGVESFYVYFYDSSYDNFLGYLSALFFLKNERNFF
jgi:hypothetical protein